MFPENLFPFLIVTLSNPCQFQIKIKVHFDDDDDSSKYLPSV